MIDNNLMWRTATASQPEGNCVKVAPLEGGGWAVCDSKDPDSPVLRFTAAEWAAFKSGVRSGEFD